ncbi:MAG TPA: hypothetical protein VJ846_10855 [Sphingomicrobium sp.]|nr:hypothetical protein [Sphingomicrobium sp.]
MTTWTPATPSPDNSWTQESTLPEPAVFSRSVFSLTFFNGLRVFALGASVWTGKTAPSSNWTRE